jgi:phosphoadenosine phosphosulfate reductase
MRGVDPDRIIEEAVARHGADRIVLLCSFQKEESVLVDAVMRVAPDIRVVTIDTGVLFPETLETWRRFEEVYDVHVEVFEATAPNGSWSAERCCGDAKVEALERALADCDAWITGIRREQAETRAHAEQVERDDRRGIWKYNPLAFWSEKDVWARIEERGLPYNPLHDAGYASIGCVPCTAPGSGREGRWAGSEKTECGLHVVTS